MRDLLVDYLRDGGGRIDHVSLVRGSPDTLGRLFWRDLEPHHPGIASLRLPPAVACGVEAADPDQDDQPRRPDGDEVRGPRDRATNDLSAVRTFYLDIAQWATDDPARWGPWAVPCPIRAGEIPHRQGRPDASHGWTSGPGNAAGPSRPGRRGRSERSSRSG